MSKQIRSQNPVAERFTKTVVFTSGERHDRMRRLLGLTWRPGDNTSHFIGKHLRPAGAAVLITMRYETGAMRPGAKPQRRIPLLGFKGAPRPDGSLDYENVFIYDGKRRPEAGARGRVVDPVRNPTILETAMAIHRACDKKADQTFKLPIVPEFPRVMLGFAPTHLPEYEETPRLRHLVAESLGVPVGRLGTKDPTLLKRQMHDVWQSSILLPEQNGNDTGLALIDAELCSSARSSLRMFEDFSHLVGVHTWNPAREVLAPTRRNPAAGILKAYGVSVATSEDIAAIPMETFEKMVVDMRRHLGGGSELFTNNDLECGLLQPNKQVTSSIENPEQAIAAIGEDQVVIAMRELLQPLMSEGATREDLLAAARNPENPLYCSGACRVQVVYQQALEPQQALCFGPDILGRRITANLFRPWSREEVAKEPVHAEATAEGIETVPAAG